MASSHKQPEEPIIFLLSVQNDLGEYGLRSNNDRHNDSVLCVNCATVTWHISFYLLALNVGLKYKNPGLCQHCIPGTAH